MGKIEVLSFDNRDDFFEYTDFSDIPIDEELLSLHDDIHSYSAYTRALHNFPRHCCHSFRHNTIQLWEDLGIKLHKVYVLRNKLDYTKALAEGLDVGDIDLVDPIEIPIDYKIPYISIPTAASTNYIFGTNELQEKVVMFENIMLHLFNDGITACFYNHEIAHTQINSTIGSCKSRLNNEVLSSLMEQITANYLDPSLEKLERIRNYGIDVIADSIFYASQRRDYQEKRKSLTYLKSYLEGFNLANIYLEGNSDIQKEMHGYINSIINGDRSVEDMLDHFDSQYEDVPKKLELIDRPIR